MHPPIRSLDLSFDHPYTAPMKSRNLTTQIPTNLIMPIRNKWNFEVVVHHCRYVTPVISTISTTCRPNMIAVGSVNEMSQGTGSSEITDQCTDGLKGTIF